MHAIILAGGKGERLRPKTKTTPKPLLLVAGKPILAWQVEQLNKAGVDTIMLLESYKADLIQDYFNAQTDWGPRLLHIEDTIPNKGTSQVVKDAARKITESEDAVIVTAGDILSNIDLKALIQAHRDHGKSATIFGRKQQLPFGIFEIDNTNEIISVREKPFVIVPAALMILDRQIFNIIPDEGDFFKNLEPIIEESGFLYQDDEATLLHISEIKDDLAAANMIWKNLIEQSESAQGN